MICVTYVFAQRFILKNVHPYERNQDHAIPELSVLRKYVGLYYLDRVLWTELSLHAKMLYAQMLRDKYNHEWGNCQVFLDGLKNTTKAVWSIQDDRVI